MVYLFTDTLPQFLNSLFKNFLYRFFVLAILTMTALNCAAKNIDRGPNLSTLDEQANYLNTKSIVKQIVAMHIYLEKKPFLLAAYDVRDGISNRIPKEDYNELLEKMRKIASPLATINTPTIEDNDTLPEGLRSASERASYLTAYRIAKSFGKNGIPVLPESIALGLNDAQSVDAPKISASDEKLIAKSIQEKLKNTDDDWATNRKNYYIAEEKKFMADNIIKPDVNLLKSGVQYKIITKGQGKNPKPNSKVTVNYRGTLLDGTVIDENYSHNKPDTFKLSAMINGFAEGLTQVPSGSKVIIYIPAALAYGEKGNDVVPPYAAMIFEVDLLDVKFGLFD